jgi:hypothetical protein
MQTMLHPRLTRTLQPLIAVATAVAILTGATPARADLSQASAASALSTAVFSAATISVVHTAAVAGTDLIVASVRPVVAVAQPISTAAGESVRVTLKGLDESIVASVDVSATVARSAGLALGQSVRVVSEATGYALLAGATLIAFIPNAIGKTLIRQERSRYGSAAAHTWGTR